MSSVDFRESAMVSCYPGEARGRYLRHCDTGRGAALTAILYLNDEWTAEDGGVLRLYEKGFHNTQVKWDVLPVANRLVLFWATEESPHEVLPTLRDRFAATIWYRDCRTLSDAASFVDTILRCSPVRPLSLADTVERAHMQGGSPERSHFLQQLGRALCEPKELWHSRLQELARSYES
eukprot:gnl/TRDRNA2_/TRDRNA2_159778_c0_seq4.p1 gnl/TRDRNA2_/TRDRNA2_159778_c0~~gnl/TRDRNA2_/TRDRNA2_159778_c0_seq4.p1  ORF type:complete len:178 (-),score=26.18 gnl/TRDRNA2_/TRDRNA2_159778_c0_seq4:98-631(-)